MNTCIRQIQASLKDKTDHILVPKKHFIINLYSYKQFKMRVKLEQRRSFRLNTQSAVVMFDFDLALQSDRAFRKEMCFLLGTFCFLTRETDAVTFKNNNTIILLLPDTNETGIRTVTDKMLTIVEILQQENPMLARIDPLAIKVRYALIPQSPSGKIDFTNLVSFSNISVLEKDYAIF